MAGYNLFAVSGIDGKFDDFDVFLGNEFPEYTKLEYQSDVSFKENCKNMEYIIKTRAKNDAVIIGWSIGAPAALALSEMCDIRRCVVINSFFDRESVLHTRKINIKDNDNIKISSLRINNKNILIIAGSFDDKIPCSESFKIFDSLKHNNHVDLYIDAIAAHKLISFSKETINLIKQNIIKGSSL